MASFSRHSDLRASTEMNYNVMLINGFILSQIDLSTTHSNVGFEICALFTVCTIMFPKLLEDKVSVNVPFQGSVLRFE